MKSNSNLFPKSSSARQMEALKKKIREAKAEEKKKKKIKKKKKPKSHFSKEERELIDEVKARGDKISEKDVVFITKDKNGKIVWLEKGHSASEGKLPSGLVHIKHRNSSQFNDKGIPNNLISKVIKKAVKEAKIVGTSGKNRDVYETKVNGRVVHHIAITISDNGYIVGAHPTSTWKEKK